MIYLIDGTEIYHMAKKKEELFHEKHFLAENIISLDGSSASFSMASAVALCSTVSLFGDRRCVVIDSPYFLRAARGTKSSPERKSSAKKDLNATVLQQYCHRPSEENDMIFYCFEFDADKRTKEYKILSEQFGRAVTQIHFGQLSVPELNRLIDITLQKNQIHMDREARGELMERIAGSTTQFYKALEKILLYGEKDLTKTDIQHLITVNPDINIWKFGDAFLKGDGAAMMRYLDELTTIERMNCQAIIPLLSYRIKTVYQAVRMEETGMSLQQMRTFSGKYQIDKDLASARGLTSRELLSMLNDLAGLDQGIKTGNIGDREGFEKFLLRRIDQCSR